MPYLTILDYSDLDNRSKNLEVTMKQKDLEIIQLTSRIAAMEQHQRDIDYNQKIIQELLQDPLKCKKAVIAELDLYDNGLIIYDFGPYLYNSKIRHRHQADARTRVRVLERVAVNKRLLDDEDIGDHHYFSRREIN
jgi:hypothetical protein